MDEYKNLRLSISLKLRMYPTQVNSLKGKQKAWLRKGMPEEFRDVILTFLISYKEALFVHLLLKSFTYDLFCSGKDFRWLKLFVFSSFSNSWELTDSIRLLTSRSCFPKFVYFMPQLSSSSRTTQYGPFFGGGHYLYPYDFTFCDYIFIKICVFLDRRVQFLYVWNFPQYSFEKA